MVKVSYYADLESHAVDWLWYPYIPYGKITILQGDPGEGKTTLALHLASLLSTGAPLPDGSVSDPINVISQSAEDSATDTIKPRLERIGADCSKIAFIQESDERLSLSDERLIEAIGKRTIDKAKKNLVVQSVRREVVLAAMSYDDEKRVRIRQQYRQENESEKLFIPAKVKMDVNTPYKPMRVRAYCRVSTDNDEQLSSFELQQAHYRFVAQSHTNWNLLHIYADEGISGTSLKKRDEFNRMI